MLSGKTALITGGSRGIGAAIARKFASMGANITIVYAGNQEAAQSVCGQCENYGVKAASYKCNVADFEEVKATVAAVRKDFGSIQILVNSAGITKDGLIPMMSEAAFDAVLDTNLKGTFNMIRHVSGLMLRSKEGCISIPPAMWNCRSWRTNGETRCVWASGIAPSSSATRSSSRKPPPRR